jgi:hypothetical protein
MEDSNYLQLFPKQFSFYAIRHTLIICKNIALGLFLAGDDAEDGTLLHDVEPPDYSATPLEAAVPLERPTMPPRGLFDDV